MKKLLAILLILFVNHTQVNAQTPNDYAAQYKKIDALEKKGLTKDALAEVIKIFADAIKNNNEAQQIKAAMYQMKYRNMVEEDNTQNNIFFVDTLIAKTKAPAKNILQSMQAELFDDYKNQNRYKLYGRTAQLEEKSNDITTWSIAKLNATTASLYKASLKNDALLKSTTLTGLTAIIDKGKNTEKLRPTLYDFLAHRALDYFMSSENDVTNPAYKFIINDEAAFASAKEFATHNFKTKDTASLYYNAILVMQSLLAFHLPDAQADALLDADVKRLMFINQHGVFTNKQKLYETALLTIENNFSTNQASAQAAYLRANIHMQKGNLYNPLTAVENQNELVVAKQICEKAFAKFPTSEGGINCKNLINQIETPSYHFDVEKVNVPDQPFRSLVQFKNIDKLYFRVVKTTRDEIKVIANKEYDKILPAILASSPLKSWMLQMPNQQDYQLHSTEIKIDALPTGVYYLLASTTADFSIVKNIIGRTNFYVSNISYITNSKNDLYVLDRETGKPLENATVQIFKNNYNYTSRKYEVVKTGIYNADKNGFVKTVKTKNYENNILQVTYKKDELFTDDQYNNYYYDDNNDDENYQQKKQTFLFTDRAIYRPGQTIFFKGIMVQTNVKNKQTTVITNRKTNVQLLDNNNQKVATVSVTTNEYGSYNGNFKIPEGLLNGNFSLKDTLTNSEHDVSVEEYKRPKFSAEIKKPDGSYRVNDSIKITGVDKAFAGNNIDGAKVTYRVVRVVRYPIWWGYYRGYTPRAADMEIANGNAVTNEKGAFNITFKAIPDETVVKASQPTFDYRISADITDINGETRSATNTVSVAYQAIKLDIVVDEKLPIDSIKNIGISSTNTNGLYQKATVNMIIYKLDEPTKMFRTRYWQQPDLFTMNKEEYYKNFPYDMYAEENNMSKWALGKQAINKTDTTSKDTRFEIKDTRLEPGFYKIIATTKDKYGEEVRAEKYVQLTVGNGQLAVGSSLSLGEGPGVRSAIEVNTQTPSSEPNKKITYNITTGFDKIYLIQNINRVNEAYKITYPTVSKGENFANTIDVTEADRGGINMNYAFVKNNRIYSGAQIFEVPWSNKDLNISYETFRDKLEPGSQEKWTVKITGNKAEKVTAETLVSMYDASLDQFKPHNWQGLQSLWPINYSNNSWSGNTFNDVRSYENNTLIQAYFDVLQKEYAALIENGWSEFNIGSKNYAKRSITMSSPSASEDRSEIVVIGYSKTTSIKNQLEGRVAGLNVKADDKNITIRGISSISADNNELIIVDGVLMSKADFEKLDANDILKLDILKGAAATAIYGDKAANGVIVITTKNGKNNAQQLNNVKTRTNFNETAFFFPDLTTDEKGNVNFSFTMPEALTQWKLQVLAHTKELASAVSSKSTITQKQLMVQPNAPRFLREGDRMEFSAKIVNLTDKEITGTSALELLDATNNKPIDGWFKNIFPNQYFTVAAGQSVAVKFPIDIPLNFNSAITYRIKAVAGSFSDGEEAAIPVLTNRMLVTETLPLNMRNVTTKTFTFDKLVNSSASTTLSTNALTVEYTSNPAWYAIQALPYLMEYPYECAEQTFSRFYANTLASNIANSNPKIKAVFDKWAAAPSPSERAGGEVSAALMSNLQKNEELKSLLLQETPWVLNAQNESKQKKNIALLFDMVRLSAEKNKTLSKLKDMQSSNGGFTWFKGGRDDRYITQYILTGIGHLRKLNAVKGADYEALKPIVDKALPYLDERLKEEYDYLIKYKVDLSKNNLSYTAIQYLYMRSFFDETKISTSATKAVAYYKTQSVKYWLTQTKYMQAMIALAANRSNDKKTAQAIIKSLQQNSISSEEMGMYFKEFTKGGYYWHQAPIESQALVIEAFTDIDGNANTINDLKTWLLKQKQTQQWPTTKATAEACYALLLQGSDWLSEEKEVTINLGNTIIKSTDEKNEAGTGYFKKRIEGDKVTPQMGNITVEVKSATNKPINQSTSYGAAYWQYFEDLDKITGAETPLKLVKKLFIEKNSDKGPILQPINDGDEIKVGDKIKVRIELKVDRDMEYVHMKDMRAAAFEPTNVISQYKYQGGLGYYESTKDASTNFFFGQLQKGSYVFEYPMFVTHSGNFSNGITTIQCMYAPEFTSHSEGVRVSVGE